MGQQIGTISGMHCNFVQGICRYPTTKRVQRASIGQSVRFYLFSFEGPLAIFTGRSAEAGLDLTLSLSQQTPNEPFRDF